MCFPGGGKGINVCVTQGYHVGKYPLSRLWHRGCCRRVDRGLDRAVVRDAGTEGPLHAGTSAPEFWRDPERCGACGLALLECAGLRPLCGPYCFPGGRGRMEGSAGLHVGDSLISWRAGDVLVTGTWWSRGRKAGWGVTESWDGGVLWRQVLSGGRCGRFRVRRACWDPQSPWEAGGWGLDQPGPGKGVEVPPCPGAAAGSGPGQPGLAHCLRPRQACLGRHMEARQARGVERLRGGPRCAGTECTLHAQGCGSLQPKVTAESAKEAADRTSLGGPGPASRALSPRSRGERAQWREGLSPRGPGPSGLSWRLLLGRLSAPEDMGLGMDPAELSGRFKSPVDTVTSQAPRRWPWLSSPASPRRVLAIGLGEVGVRAPAVLLRAGQPSDQHRC